jgi:hypothetical protein
VRHSVRWKAQAGGENQASRRGVHDVQKNEVIAMLSCSCCGMVMVLDKYKCWFLLARLVSKNASIRSRAIRDLKICLVHARQKV